MLSRSKRTKLDRVNLVTTVGDTIIRKYRNPRGSIETRIGLLHLPGRIINRKNYPHLVSGELRLARRFHYRRRVVNINRFTQPLAG